MANSDNTVYMATDENGNDQGLIFYPSKIEIRAGTTVRWKNLDEMDHTATSDSGSAEVFDSGAVEAGSGTFEHTFNTPGTYKYHCTYHGSDGSGMAGTINVT